MPDDASGPAPAPFSRRFLATARRYRAWWLTPVLLVAVLLVVLLLAGYGLVPFHYTLF